jgi:hypothetical protein
MVDFQSAINTLINIGFYSVFLPFLLIYVVVFAILEKAKLFVGGNSDEKQARNIHSIIAFVFGLFLVASIQTVMYIQSLIINAILFIVFFLVIIVVLSLIFGEKYKELFEHKYVKWTLFGLIIIGTLILLLSLFGFWDYVSNLSSIFDDDTFTSLLVFGLIIGVLVWVTKGSDSKK